MSTPITPVTTLGTPAARAAALAANPTPPVRASAPLGGAGQAFSDDPFARMLEQNRQAARLQARREAERERPAAREASPDPVRVPEPSRATAQRPATPPVQPAEEPAKPAEPPNPMRERSSRLASQRPGGPAADPKPSPARAAPTRTSSAGPATAEAGDAPESPAPTRPAPSRGRQALADAEAAADAAQEGRPDTRKAATGALGGGPDRRHPGATLAPPAGGPVAGPGVGSPSAAGGVAPGGPAAGSAAAAANGSAPDAGTQANPAAGSPGLGLVPGRQEGTPDADAAALSPAAPAAPAAATSSLSPFAAPTGGTAASDAQAPTLAELQAQASLPAHPTSSAFGAQLGVQVSLWLKGGVQQAQLHLNPAELGPVRVSIRLDGLAAQVSFSAEQAPTRQALEQALPTLAGSLADAGFTLAGGGVFDHPPGQAQGQAMAERGQPGHSADGRHGPNNGQPQEAHAAAAGPARPRGMVDLVA